MRRFSRRTVLGLAVTLLLTIVPTALDGKRVKAYSQTVYIRADGSIDPSEAPISSLDYVVYVLAGNISCGIAVQRDNIVVDGGGYAVKGTGSGSGVDLGGRSNVTIKNVRVESFSCGIRLQESTNIMISGNKIADNQYGISFDFALNTRNCVSANNISNNMFGIALDGSYNNISGNSIRANGHGAHVYDQGYGIYVYGSSNNVFRHNDVSDNKNNFEVRRGPFLSQYIHDIDDSNTVNGKPVYYWINRQDLEVPLDAGWVALINCTRITVKNQNLTGNAEGVLLAFTANSTIAGNCMTSNQYGIVLDTSSDNRISRNNMTKNAYCSLMFVSSSNNSISRNSISGNNMTCPWYAGIVLQSSSDNSFYHNNFINNTIQVNSYESRNIWDDGYPSGGNHWSDHVCIGNPSDGSQIYSIDADNTDHHPFQDPIDWRPPVAEAGESRTVAEGAVLSFNATGSSDNVGIVSYEWDFGDGTNGTGIASNHAYDRPGNYTVTLTVRDSFNNADTDSIVVTVLVDTDGDEIPDTNDADDDGDGMHDAWEIENSFQPLDAADASLDPDGDGLTNLQEYQQGTDPNNYLSPFPSWIVGVPAAAIVVAAIVVYYVSVRKP